jgi:Transposase DDE domain group 1
VWGHRAPIPATGPVVVDLDATLIGAHSEKEGATPNFERGFGFHPLLAFIEHGAGGTGEPLVAMLRPGRANANNAADQIAVLDAALAQLPDQLRARVLVRGDSGSGCSTSTTWGWPTRWASRPANPSRTRWQRCPSRPGAPPSIPTAAPVRAPKSPS